MKPAVISIIIPVYNVEKFLRKCLTSVIEQTFSDIEILLIDDGSTDKSGIICDEYAKIDKRIKVFHKKNGGLSSARNFGIDNATGDYLGFVDSDDYIERDMYETLLNLIEDNNADMSMCALYDIYCGKPLKVNKEIETFVVCREDAIRMEFEAEIVSVTAVNKLYKKELFEDLRYPLGKTAEDAFLIVDLLSKCSSVAITTAQKYNYVHRSDSITTKRFNGNIDAIDAYEKNYQTIIEQYPSLEETAKMRLCWANFYVLDHLLFDDRIQFKDIKNRVIEYLRQNVRFILANEQFHISRKFAAILLRIDWRLYKICLYAQNKRRQIE
jgi:glycosyltransferase involved in cell wall biosynthesis